MFILERRHMQIFEQASLQRFADEFVVHCREFSPHVCDTLTADELRKAVHIGIEKAKRHGFTRYGTIRFYLDMAMLLGSEFDTDPQYPWAGEILRDSAEDRQGYISECLHTATLDYIQAVESVSEGPIKSTRESLQAALLGLDQARIKEDCLADEILWIFSKTNPGRSSHLQRLDAMSIITRYRKIAEEFLADGNPRGVALLVLCMLELGHQFVKDPFYIWITRTNNPAGFVDVNNVKQQLESWCAHE